VIVLTAYLQEDNDDAIKFKIYIMRRFGLHPELVGQSIVVPDIERPEADRLMQSINAYDNKSLSEDLTEAVNTFIIGL